MYDDFTEYDFTGAEISNIKVSLSLSGKTEAVSKGVFTVNDTSYDGDIITLECLDNMHKFDVNYSKSNLIYPATLLQIVQDACRCCGVTLATDSLQFEYYNYVIQKKPDDNTMTFRDVLTWVGQISGHFGNVIKVVSCQLVGTICQICPLVGIYIPYRQMLSRM